MANSRGSACNKGSFAHKIFNLIKLVQTRILQLTITDCKQEGGAILCAYEFRFYLRRHNLPATDSYVLPVEIIQSGQSKYFNESELQFIKACDAFNKMICLKTTKAKVSKIVMGEKTTLRIRNRYDPTNFLSFEFDERLFTGLMKKYRSPSEIRKMIKAIFTAH